MTAFRLLAVTVVLLLSSSCAVFRAVPRSGSSTAADDALSATDILDRGEQSLAAGNLGAAADQFELLVDTHPDTPEAARALFQLAALHWNPASAAYDPASAIDRLRQVVEDHPGSPWTPAATAVLNLTSDKVSLQRAVAELQAQLDELKQLDLGPRG